MRTFLFIFFLPIFTLAKVKESAFEMEKILDIEIGSDSSKAKNIMGQMATNTEKFSSIAYDVWEYADAKGRPRGYLTIDPKTQKVASKAVWVYADEPEHKMDDFALSSSTKNALSYNHRANWKTDISKDRLDSDSIK